MYNPLINVFLVICIRSSFTINAVPPKNAVVIDHDKLVPLYLVPVLKHFIMIVKNVADTTASISPYSSCPIIAYLKTPHDAE